MGSNKNIQALKKALADKGSRVSYSKETVMDLLQKQYHNKFQQQDKFDAVVLKTELVNKPKLTPSDVGSGASLGASTSIYKAYVRPVDIHDLIVPEPCKFKDKASIEYCVSLHPIAMSENIMEDGVNNIILNPGDIVSCEYLEGPDNPKGMMGLRFNPRRAAQGKKSDYKKYASCLTKAKYESLVSYGSRARRPSTSQSRDRSKSTVKSVSGKYPTRSLLALEEAMKARGITNRYAKIAILSVVAKESSLVPKNEYSYKNTGSERLMKLFAPRLNAYFKSQGWSKEEGLKKLALKNPDGSKNENRLQKDDIKFYDIIYGNIAIQLIPSKWKWTGHTQSGDGYKYRGRGFNQITFKASYEKVGKRIGVDLVAHPEKMLEPETAAKATVDFLLKRLKSRKIDKNGFTNQKDANIIFANANAGWGKKPSKFENGQFVKGTSSGTDSVDRAINNTWSKNPAFEDLYTDDGTLNLPSGKHFKKKFQKPSCNKKDKADNEIHLQGTLIPERSRHCTSSKPVG